MKPAGVLILWLLLTGCAARRTPAAYRLVRQDSARILIPPGVRDAAVAERTFVFRTTTRRVRACAISERGIVLRPRRGGLRVTVRRQAATEQPRGWLSVWGASIEQRGCASPGDGLRLAARIADALPLDPALAYGLLRPELRIGYVDLGPEHRVRVVAPILREGAKASIESAQVSGDGRSLNVTVKASPDFLGYETSWYVLAERSDRNGVRIVPESAEARIDGEVTRSETPRVNPFAFAPEAAWFRLFFLTRRSQSDHDIAILAARTRAALDELTPQFERDPESCAKAAGAGMCVVVPRAVAVSPHLLVTVNDKPVRVPVQTALAEAIRAAGESTPSRVLPTLAVRRPYAGVLMPVDFDRASNDILAIPLRGGEDIRW